MNLRMSFSLALAGAMLIAGYIGCEVAVRAGNIITYSESGLLTYSWDDYKRRNLEPGTGRVINRQTETTTSEGQSYAMLRSVWIGDRPEFDLSWRWTRENLQHSQDHLFAWLYGRSSDGNLGIMSQQGGNGSATDADTDIALALILAYARWHDGTYLDQAREIAGDIWQFEVVSVGSASYVTADDMERNSPRFILLNPSYLEPYAYRLFAQIDKRHDWSSLVMASYRLLDRALNSPLGGDQSSGLPPDWVRLDRSTGELLPSKNPQQTTNFGFDAIRTPWRIAVDWQWNHSAEAYSSLNRMSALSAMWRRGHKLEAVYGHDGAPRVSFESRAMYGAALGYFLVIDPQSAQSIYASQIVGRFRHATRSWEETYYDENWLWFGAALKQGLVSDLGAGKILQQP